MALLPYVDPDEAPPSVETHLNEERERLGRVPLYDAILAHEPTVLSAAHRYHAALMAGDRLDRRLKELAYVAVSMENDCEYCTAAHVESLVERLEVPESMVEEMARDDLAPLEERERLVVRTARQVARDPQRLGAADLDRCRDVGFDEAAIVELVATCAEAVHANTIAQAFSIHPGDYEHGELSADGTGRD